MGKFIFPFKDAKIQLLNARLASLKSTLAAVAASSAVCISGQYVCSPQGSEVLELCLWGQIEIQTQVNSVSVEPGSQSSSGSWLMSARKRSATSSGSRPK